MIFDNASFIKPDVPFDKDHHGYAPRFRKSFVCNDEIVSATLFVCGLGIGYYYINGKKVSDDLFTSPFGDYRKTLWYNEYDVTHLLTKGENLFAAECGNGWYNESSTSSWGHHLAEWRDIPKLAVCLVINGKTVVRSDESFRFSLDSASFFNQLRVGEFYDSRKDDTEWKKNDFDDSSWAHVCIDDKAPTGIPRKCMCEPIREFEEYSPVNIIRLDEDVYIYDFGQNMSGYVRLCTDQAAGDEITLEYVERFFDDLSIDYGNMLRCWPDGIFQTDRFICCGKKTVWTPKFTYKGFRYVKVTGLKNPCKKALTAVFVHQAIAACSFFECSDDTLNSLFKIGIFASYSNMFYMPTDCPTREKLGWMNDAQASTEQFLTNFEAEKMLEKWLYDIFDAMKDNGELPGIVPTPGWGYEWGNGPVSDGALFEIPYRIYLHTKNSNPLKAALPYFKRYLDYLPTRKDEKGELSFGLDDWAAPDENDKVGSAFINAVLSIKFLSITVFALELFGDNSDVYRQRLEKEKHEVIEKYISADGKCIIRKQTAVAMLIYHGIYEKLSPLKEQLKTLVEEKDFHHDCGMCGLRHLYMALNKCDLHDYAFRIITAKGFPSYSLWLEDGATTLYEMWEISQSKNHHMFSDFMSWIMKTVVGINMAENSSGFEKAEISPVFFEKLTFARGNSRTAKGKISVEWIRKGKYICVTIAIPEGMKAFFKGIELSCGINSFICDETGNLSDI